MTEIIGLQYHDVTPDGTMLNLIFEGKYGEQVQLSMPTDNLDALLISLDRVKLEASERLRPTRMVLNFRGLQSWAVAAVPGYEYVFLVLDGSTALEAGYALRPEAAEEFASAMVGTSKAVRAQRRDN